MPDAAGGRVNVSSFLCYSSGTRFSPHISTCDLIVKILPGKLSVFQLLKSSNLKLVLSRFLFKSLLKLGSGTNTTHFYIFQKDKIFYLQCHWSLTVPWCCWVGQYVADIFNDNELSFMRPVIIQACPFLSTGGCVRKLSPALLCLSALFFSQCGPNITLMSRVRVKDYSSKVLNSYFLN